MRRTSVAGIALALLTLASGTSNASASPLLTLRHDGGAFTREDPYLPSAAQLGVVAPPGGGSRPARHAAAVRATHGGGPVDPGRASATALRATASAKHGATPANAKHGATPANAEHGGTPANAKRGATPASAERGATPASAEHGATPANAERGTPANAARAASTKRTVKSELARMLAAGAIDRPTYDARLATYADARRLLRKLGGARRAALGAVLDNLDAIAARGDLDASRLPELFETVARNRQWWANGPLLGDGQRVSFQGSPLVWQYYTGEGLQIQWLGTFGKANALWASKDHDTQLRQLLDAALSLAAQRAGGIAFEYLFDWDGGHPPWVSGLAQGTGIQALSRAAVRLNEPRYFTAARSALGIFREAPPSGVRVPTAHGVHYLLYSFAPRLRVLNAFTQALNGLHDFALLANDAEGRMLFASGETELRAALPSYDTGAWSRYSLQREANLSYHKLARDFLQSLCTKLRDDAARAAAPATAPGAAGSGGAIPVPGAPPPPPPSSTPASLADPTPYCDEAQRFTTYLRQPPVVKLVSERARAGKPAALRLSVSKPAYVKLAVLRGDRTVTVLGGQFSSGDRTLEWSRPRAAATYEVMLRATDLAGNVGSAKGSLDVLRARR